MSRAIILMDADDADLTMIMQDDNGDNVVFPSVDAADQWLERNAELGWCTRIVELGGMTMIPQGDAMSLHALIAEARREYRDSDAAGDVLDWLEERADELAAALAGGGGACRA